MSVRQMFTTVGAALTGLVDAGGTGNPPAEPDTVRRLLADLGLPAGDGSAAGLAAAVRRFQERAGLTPDGIAGPRTVHHLARYARQARDLRRLDLADRPAA
jgi:hypothetical protein